MKLNLSEVWSLDKLCLVMNESVSSITGSDQTGTLACSGYEEYIMDCIASSDPGPLQLAQWPNQ